MQAWRKVLAAYRRVYDFITCRLTAKNRDQLWNPTLCNRIWVTFTFLVMDGVDSSSLRCTHSPSCLAWSESCWPFGTQSVFIRWAKWTLAMALHDDNTINVMVVVIKFIITLPPIGEWSFVMSMSVCLSVCDHVFASTHPIFTKFFVHATCGKTRFF